MLKLAILSDPHLGFAPDAERSRDAYNNLKLAFELALKHEPDLVLIAGDIFHDKVPKQEAIGEAIELFSQLKSKMKRTAMVTKKANKDGISEGKAFIPPIIGIWGTHERRHQDSTNPTQLLHKAGLMHVLHAESVFIEVNNEKIGLHGLSGVPEQYAKGALEAWNPKPFEGGANVFMIHQNFQELLPPVEHALQFSDLPAGFDLYLLGHVHSTSVHKHPVGDKPIINIGSTVSTQMQASEVKTQKGFYIVNVARQNISAAFTPIETRKLFYEKLDVNGLKPIDIINKITETIQKCSKEKYSLKPMLRIKLDGVLADGFSPADLNTNYKDQGFIINIDKSKLRSSGFEEQSKLLAELKAKKLSVEQIGLDILRKNLKSKIEFDKLEKLFSLLVEGKTDEVEREIC